MTTKMRTPAYSILETLLEQSGAAVGLIYGYSSDRSRMRLVDRIGVEFAFPPYDVITDCWAKRLAAHEQNSPYDLYVQDLEEGGPCRQRYLDIGCDYSLSYPIIRSGKLIGFVAALWRSIPTLTGSCRNAVARAALDLTEIVDDAGYPREAKDDELAESLETVAKRFEAMCRLQIGINQEQKILYWRDPEKSFKFDSDPIGLYLPQIFADNSFGEIHQKMIERFIDGDYDYKPMNMNRPVQVKNAEGQIFSITIAQLERVSSFNTYGALAIGFIAKTVSGGVTVPDLPGDKREPLDKHEARAFRVLDKVADTTQKVNLSGALGLAVLVIVCGVLVLAYQGKLHQAAPLPKTEQKQR